MSWLVATRDDIPDPHSWSKPIFKPSAHGSPIPIVFSSSSKRLEIKKSMAKLWVFFGKRDFSARLQQDDDFIVIRRKAFDFAVGVWAGARHHHGLECHGVKEGAESASPQQEVNLKLFYPFQEVFHHLQQDNNSKLFRPFQEVFFTRAL